MNILLADDDQSIRDSLSEILTMLGHSVVTFSNAEAALGYLQKNKPHLILTDMNMGVGMNGHAFLIAAKKIHFDLPVVIMTAFSTVKSAVENIKDGAYEYLAKPLDLSIIENLLDRVMGLIATQVFSLEGMEKQYIKKVLEYTETYEQASEILGINMCTLWRKRKTYQIETSQKRF